VAINYQSGQRHRLNFTAAPFNISASNWLACWVKYTTDAGGNQFLWLQSRDTGSGTGAERWVRVEASNQTSIDGVAGGPTLVVDSWYYVLYEQTTGSDARIWYSSEGATGDLTDSGVNAGSYGTAQALNYLTVGAYLGGAGELLGSLCCLRGGSGTLTMAEKKAERDSATAVKAGAYIDWRMDTTSSTPTYTGTLTTTGSPSTDTDEPSNIASASTTRGMPFGNRSTAFNGGRILTGPLY
jgi:hypothetical protein